MPSWGFNKPKDICAEKLREVVLTLEMSYKDRAKAEEKHNNTPAVHHYTARAQAIHELYCLLNDVEIEKLKSCCPKTRQGVIDE